MRPIPASLPRDEFLAHLQQVLERIDGGLSASLERLFELLRFPSVATDPRYHDDCRKAAEWLKREFDTMGFATSLRGTTGQPVVLAKYAPEGLPSHAPHVLFYGHYDVQPADPIELWTSPPFEPQVRKGKDGKNRIFARGASDDKGQLMTFLEATRAWLSVHGTLPFRLTILLEGDEEGDSTHLDRFVAGNRRELAADVAFICDTGLWDDDTPAIITSLRGCIYEEVCITGPKIDLHSGELGGPALNPIKVLSRVLAAMHGTNGRIAIPGFYDGVKPVSPALRRQWAKLNFPAKRFLKDVGLGIPAGENAFTPLEQMWARPTAEVNGIWGGYRGAGMKTVLPSQASAKLSFRLVAGQSPKHVRKVFREFVRVRLPDDCRASFISQGGDNSGVSVDGGSKWVMAAKSALAEEWGKSPLLAGAGYSIPVVQSFKKHLKIDSLLVGFERVDDNAHSPDEKYDVECFHKGIRSWARIISQFA